MYSMNYIGKFIAKFYNEINGATLTGAIDVVVVEQPDGSFTCSPFHVRFGKLGVLRSRFKVVDLELNGEPLNIHMKLGESGEAFFVEEVGEDEAECAAHLATSPIPATRFDDLYEPRRRNSLSAVEPDHGQASDYTKRRYTADGKSMQKPDLSKLGKNKKDDKKTVDDHDNEALFEMDGLNEGSSDWTDSKPKTFAATQLGAAESEANQTVQKISEHNDFRPIDAPSQEDLKPNNGNGKKKKKTRKVSSKKKHQRKSSTSSISSQSDLPSSEQRSSQPTSIPNTTDINFFSDTEVVTGGLSEEMSNLNLKGDNRIPLALSDTAFEVHSASRHSKGSRHGTPVQSDTEMELQRAANGDKSSQSWRWGELPEPPLRGAQIACPESPGSPASPAEPASPTEPLSSDEERTERRGVLSGMFRFMSTREAADTAPGGVYLDDLDRGQVDPDLYFPKHHADRYRTVGGNAGIQAGPTEEEYESGNGPSLPQSPNSPASLDAPTLDSDDDEKLLAKGQVSVMAREGAVSRALSYEEFCMQGAALASTGQLEVRLGTRRMPWRSAGPLLLSLLAYRRPLPNRVLEELEKGEKGEESASSRADEAKPRSYSWWYWRRSNTDKRSESSQPKDDIQDVTPQSDTAKSLTPKTGSVDEDQVDHWTEGKMEPPKHVTDVDPVVKFEEVMDVEETTPMIPTREVSVRHDHSSSDSEHETHHMRTSRRQSSFRKTLRLSSDQIKKLNLREGMNEMVFSVTTAYQGTTRCKCNVFRWRHDDKVVISDIDGTITKSDVLGHIFPLVGKDWAQSGVAQLFTKIKNNGYQLLYLSARAIGQARVTREYLRSIKQGEVCLPDGPLLLNPTSLLRAFHREVIEKKPEEFKIQCLADIKALFPAGSNPFYAGYGNRVNDVCAYQAVGIPIVRIFTINYKGELKHELTQTFQSTYSHMSVLVDQVFPPAQCEPSDEFSQCAYWREPLPLLDLPAHAAPAPH
ncbi:phosphatidate phosphatase LPIN2 isoform X1 [Maniola jurtina]|uniref:phosphatidate phosphatase LPIN2 isoform X1 n=1 Tax=Maniola jurtina TaxID=191418 RepID=UPI001E68B9D2|nr:phosphatidate phosphatase LPIN2 isoform X1 [Maniola jurtina]XP_045775104.1 phosphatidate phosphatase LPIN2 isoform X1 [Maniola jurtina]